MVASRGHMFELLIQGSVEMAQNKAPPPPFYVFVDVIRALIKNRALLKQSLLCTALFMPSRSLQTMVKYILSVYHPTRPVAQFDNLGDAKKYLLESRQAGLDAYAEQHVGQISPNGSAYPLQDQDIDEREVENMCRTILPSQH